MGARGCPGGVEVEDLEGGGGEGGGLVVEVVFGLYLYELRHGGVLWGSSGDIRAVESRMLFESRGDEVERCQDR